MSSPHHGAVGRQPAEEQHPAVHGRDLQGGDLGLGGGAGGDDHVRAAAAGELQDPRDHLAGDGFEARLQRLADRQALGGQVVEHHFRGSAQAGQLGVHQPDRAGADDQHPVPGADGAALEGIVHAGEGLGQGRGGERHLGAIGQRLPCRTASAGMRTYSAKPPAQVDAEGPEDRCRTAACCRSRRRRRCRSPCWGPRPPLGLPARRARPCPSWPPPRPARAPSTSGDCGPTPLAPLRYMRMSVPQIAAALH